MRPRFIWKLYLGYVILVVLSTAIVSFLIHYSVKHDSLLEIERTLLRQAYLAEEIARPLFTGKDRSEINERLTALEQNTDIRLTVIGEDGVVLADSSEDPLTMENHGTRPEVLAARRNGWGSQTRFSHTLKHDMMYVALVVTDGQNILGFVRTALPLAQVNAQLVKLRHTVFLGMAVALLLSLPLGYLFARLVTRPLAEMTIVAQACAQGDYGRKIHTRSNDEIGTLADALNEMSEHLNERLETIIRDRNQLAAILSSMVEGVIAVDRQEKIVHINAVARNMCAGPQEDSVGMHAWEVVRIPRLTEAISQALMQERAVECEITLTGETADAVYLMQTTPWRSSEGEVVGAVAVLHNVSRLRQLERARQEFVANASHELKSPVSAIRGLAETILDDQQMDSIVQMKFVQSIMDEAVRLGFLVRDLLALSQAESGTQTESLSSLNLREVAEKAVMIHRANAKTKGVELTLQQPDYPVTVVGRFEALSAAVGNLVDNAIKYTPRGGKVTVSVCREESNALLSVTDTGLGIAKEHQERIFERFYRVDTARSRELGGTGLGLAIVKHTVLSHGGEVQLVSKPGAGSTFTLVLPSPSADINDIE